MTQPKIICLTPVRNEAWILKAFLSATSLWADIIIIADQMSTDGSREIARQFPKVKLLENNRSDIHMGDVRCMLMEEARKIDGDKILVTLDADEFWAGDFTNTLTWKRILNSEPDDVFEFKWINLRPGMKTYRLEPTIHFNWVIHASEDFFESDYPKNRFIHEPRLRWSRKTTEGKEFLCDDMRAIHFCHVNEKRVGNKLLFYQFSSVAIPNKVYNIISLYRQYNQPQNNACVLPIPEGMYDWYLSKGVDILALIDFSDIGKYYTEQVQYYLERDGAKKYAILDVWNKDFCEFYHQKDPRNGWQKLVHLYLRATKKYSRSMLVRVIDKVLKKIY